MMRKLYMSSFAQWIVGIEAAFDSPRYFHHFHVHSSECAASEPRSFKVIGNNYLRVRSRRRIKVLFLNHHHAL